MKLVLFILVVIALAISFVIPNTFTPEVKAMGSCPLWLVEHVPGSCLTSVHKETVTELPDWFQYTENWKPDRNLVSFRFDSIQNPEFPFLLGSNFNKWSLYPDWVYVDERMMDGLYFKTLYVGAKLVCDAEGSKTPMLIISIPNSEIIWRYPQNIYFTVTNYGVVNQPCSY